MPLVKVFLPDKINRFIRFLIIKLRVCCENEQSL